MFKPFNIAAAVVVMPLLNLVYKPLFTVAGTAQKEANIFLYKNTLTTIPRPDDPFGRAFEPEKKAAAEPWSQNWMATAQENIRKSEYNFVWEEKLKAYCTPSRKNNLRFFYNDKGFVVEPGKTKIPVDKVD